MLTKVLLSSFITALLATSLSGCGGGSSLETPNTSGTQENNALISQKNFTIIASELAPKFVDLTGVSFTLATSDMTVSIADNNGSIITAPRTILFKTEWGTMPKFCTTENGQCTVKWTSGKTNDLPFNFQNTIVAYSETPDIGQETFFDTNTNNQFDDNDASFSDLDEPFLDTNENGIFDAGDQSIDTINGIDPSGSNGKHDSFDGFYNGPNCSHSTQCSIGNTNRIVSTVWGDISLQIAGSDQFTVGGTIAGLVGTVTATAQFNNDANRVESLAISSTTVPFTFTLTGLPGTPYEVIVGSPSGGGSCGFANGTNTGFIARAQNGAIVKDGNITNVTIVCTP